MQAPDVSASSAQSDLGGREPDREKLILDPRDGDAEDDVSSPKQKSLLAIAGSLLAEISLTKLLLAWIASIVLPAAILGLAPLIVTAWVGGVFSRVLELYGFGAALLLVAIVAVGWFGWRPLFRVAEANFWALNALGVQPGYALCREAIRHLAERSLTPRSGAELARMRARSCAAAGILLAAVAALVASVAWPATRWIGSTADLAVPHLLILPTLANAIVIMSAYLVAASLVWGFADATMDQPLDLETFDAAPSGGRVWRVAHLSDIHIVGERYGFRIESGRGGPRGNERVRRVMARLAAEHAARPLDLILITGDMTDAGRSGEWAEFFDILAGHPDLADRMLVLPGNHDVNVVDRANPARLDLPFSPAKTLRKMRALSAMAVFGADRLRVMSVGAAEPGLTLAGTLGPQRQAIESFADQGGLRLSNQLARFWDELFPLILPPAEDDGLGVAILNSNADTNFSFTNALGMIPAGQARKLIAAFDHYAQARWIVGLHHHLIEYPMPVAAFSERIGTALINGSWFQRVLKPYSERVVVMHGHRHVDWIGACGKLKIVSAPSPVMAADSEATHFYVHTLGPGSDGGLTLAKPKRIDLAPGD
jgi:Calcineurin-like phosphoesterase